MRVFGHRERQCQSERAAQAAPGDCELVSAAHPLTEVQCAQCRQQPEQYRHARDHRRCERDQEKPKIL